MENPSLLFLTPAGLMCLLKRFSATGANVNVFSFSMLGIAFSHYTVKKGA